MGTAYRFADILYKNVVSKTGTYTAKLSDDGILCSGASWTLGVPTAVGNKGKRYFIGHFGTSGTDIYTIDPNGAETIGGLVSLRLCTNGDFVVIESDGAKWLIRSKNINVFVLYRNTAGTAYTASAAADVPFATKVTDNRSIFATPTATIELAGTYDLEAQVGQFGATHTTTQFQEVTILKGGSAIGRDIKYGNGAASGIFTKASAPGIPCSVGDQIKVQIRSSVNITFANGVGDCFFALKRIGD